MSMGMKTRTTKTINGWLPGVSEKAMATHSSTLAWKIPWMGEPGGLPSMGSHRVGHDWSDLAAAAAAQVYSSDDKIWNIGGSIDLCEENELSMLLIDHVAYRWLIGHLTLGIIIVYFFNLNWCFYNQSMTNFLSYRSWSGLFTNLTGSLPSSVSKESACNAGDLGSIPGLGRSPGGGNGNPLQYSCLEYSRDRGAWQTTVYGVPRVGHDWVTKHILSHDGINLLHKLLLL